LIDIGPIVDSDTLAAHLRATFLDVMRAGSARTWNHVVRAREFFPEARFAAQRQQARLPARGSGASAANVTAASIRALCIRCSGMAIESLAASAGRACARASARRHGTWAHELTPMLTMRASAAPVWREPPWGADGPPGARRCAARRTAHAGGRGPTRDDRAQRLTECLRREPH